RTARCWFRIVHFSVQSNHVHLLVEADDKVGLGRGLMGAAIRIARAVNRVAGRRGRVWGDRYHARALRTPRDVRHGIVYVIMNWKKHLPEAKGFDRCSSAWSFTGWIAHPSSGPPAVRAHAAPPPHLFAPNGREPTRPRRPERTAAQQPVLRTRLMFWRW